VPIKKIEVLHASSKLWARIQFDMEDKDVVEALPNLRARQAFSKCLSQVQSSDEGRVWFEALAANKSGFDTAISNVAKKLRAIGIGPILTAQGYRFYFANTAPRDFVPYLAAVYCISFYLGSVTRYKPDVFDKIISGRYSWVIAEFLATQPTQFLYSLASDLAGVDVGRPYASVA
jgi:hypothetical protein